jgi:DMSO/TMAO reductase YedYZ heme-binding membrane subunit
MLWFTTRATGVVALVLLTVTVVLGILTSVRFETARWPRFTLQDLHRRTSLLAVVFVTLHVVTTVSDSFAPIGWLSVFVPFTSPYRRLWLGLGTVAVDLLLAVTVSSILRRRIHPRTWRGLHWLAYASWPLALVHGLGTGTDPHLEWMIVLVIVCVTAVLVAVTWRLVEGWPSRAGARATAGVASIVAVLGLAAWTEGGPLRPGWAQRAGTPPSLLSSSRTSVKIVAPPVTARPVALPLPPYRASLAGTVTQRTQSGGTVQIDIRTETSGTVVAVLDVIITGTPDGSGGVVMQQSQVSFGPPAAPTEFRGQISGLDGSQMDLAVADAGGRQVDLHVDVSISGNQVTGLLSSAAAPEAAGSVGGTH